MDKLKNKPYMKHYEIKEIKRLLVANRGEIAVRILRAASELKIRTVAVYTYEDRYSLHRYKADEAYQIGTDEEALKPYLDIEEIISTAKEQNIDAIHPGYGFLSENATFARRCGEEGIIFVGPTPEAMEAVGDKVTAKTVARKVNVPVIEDSDDLTGLGDAQSEAARIGYPVMVKAAAGGGGRGMRVVKTAQDLDKAYNEAKTEARTAFGDDTVFIEKYVENPKHIEVQIMADKYGHTVHLFERDCSVQRRFQKVVEIAPAPSLSQDTKEKLYKYAKDITESVNYSNVGTVEFLIDPQNNIYFIEVNPRIQVEHTITEEITGIDIVRTQILIAQGYRLSDPYIYIRSQEDVKINGFAVQCRVTTEDPNNNFRPDFGRIIAYRTATGFGVRLDEGSAYPGAVVSPYFDSMIVKVTCWGRTLRGACQRINRALREFRIRGVQTNIGFLENLIESRDFQRGAATVNYIAEHPELFEIKKRRDRGTKILRYLSDVIVNGHPDVGKALQPDKYLPKIFVPDYPRHQEPPAGTRQQLQEMGRDAFVQHIRKDNKIHYTDTTFRDAHQSLLATRMRTIDMMRTATAFAHRHPETFSMEVWGGATFDVSMRFLKECPWQRLQQLRQAVPNILFQMLLRGSNGVGYTAYPDNLIVKFIEKAAENGIDIFRIFDSLNWIENMKVSIRAVRENTNALAEAVICYSGDLTDPEETKYTLDYYLDLAKALEAEGAHIICVKDMAGLLKPFAARLLIAKLKETVSIPVHLHSHDTSSLQAATYLQAIEANVDIVDVAIASMSGLTSQPNFNSLVAAMQNHSRERKVNLESLNNFF